MAALIIGGDQRRKIAELIAMAKAAPFDAVAVKRAADRDLLGFRDMMRMQSIELPIGFHVAYSREIQPEAPPPGLCHHISISVDRPGKMPSEEAAEMILTAFGMRSLRQSEGLWIEDIDATTKAINIIQLVRANDDEEQQAH